MVSNWGMRRVWLGALLVCAACASAPIKKPDQAALDQADALVRQGCYDCLLEARTTFTRIAVGKARPLVLGRLFEVELLLSLREKELAMEHQPALDRARALAAELPPALEPLRYLAIADAVPPDDMGSPRSEDTDFRRARAAFIPKINGEMSWLETAGLGLHFRQYLSHAIDCMYLRRPPPQQPRAWVRRDMVATSPPLVAYRIGICDFPKREILEKVRAAEPRFVETAFFLARLEVNAAAQTGKGRPREPLTEAYARFPRSASVTYLFGNYNQLGGDCLEALRYYDETLALKPVHENGLLGRTVCLSFLKRTAEAIAAATHMIEVKPFNIDEAYYWRAWNYHLLADLPPARRDIDAAKARASNARIHTLAGIIEHDQDDLDVAERDLIDAKRGPEGGQNCTARWYLGLVEMKRTRWTESGTHFEDAMRCYEGSIIVSETSIATLEANPDLDPIFRMRQISNFRAQIDSDRSQQYAAAFNAANHYAHGGQIPKARVLIEVAARDPGLADRIAALRKMIGG
jgi:tetratricopeptide (TPR) repeat protein